MSHPAEAPNPQPAPVIFYKSSCHDHGEWKATSPHWVDVPHLWRPRFRELAKHCIVPWIGSQYNFTHTELITESFFEY